MQPLTRTFSHCHCLWRISFVSGVMVETSSALHCHVRSQLHTVAWCIGLIKVFPFPSKPACGLVIHPSRHCLAVSAEILSLRGNFTMRRLLCVVFLELPNVQNLFPKTVDLCVA